MELGVVIAVVALVLTQLTAAAGVIWKMSEEATKTRLEIQAAARAVAEAQKGIVKLAEDLQAHADKDTERFEVLVLRQTVFDTRMHTLHGDSWGSH